MKKLVLASSLLCAVFALKADLVLCWTTPDPATTTAIGWWGMNQVINSATDKAGNAIGPVTSAKLGYFTDSGAKAYDDYVNNTTSYALGFNEDTYTAGSSVSVGSAVGSAVGSEVGSEVGEDVGVPVGTSVGVAVGILLGVSEGVTDGIPLGIPEGITDGMPLGIPEGITDGMPLGISDGIPDGIPLGIPDGIRDGSIVGIEDGRSSAISSICSSAARKEAIRDASSAILLRISGVIFVT